MSYRFVKNSSKDFFDYTMDRVLKVVDEDQRNKQDLDYIAQIISGDSLGGDTTTPQENIKYVNLNGKVAMAFKIRFTEKSSKYNFVEDPYPISSSATMTEAERQMLVSMHDDAYLEAGGLPTIPKFGDIVVCSRQEGRIFVIEDVLTNRNILSGISITSGNGLGGLEYSVGGPALGTIANNSPLDFSNVQIKPIKSFKGSRDAAGFNLGACPNALTNSFKTLPRKEKTWFYVYSRDSVVAAIKKNNPPLHVQATMWAYIAIEQPDYDFPNNNPSGIQSDGKLFKGTTINDYDYQTCYKDSETWRAFAGFNTLERGMKVFAAILTTRYKENPRWKIFDRSTGLEDAATIVADNYYTGWVINASEKELELIKRGLPFTRKTKKGIKTYKKNYRPTRGLFKKKIEEYLSF